MKRFLPLFLLVAGVAQAQNFRPFRPGLTYQFAENNALGDTTHVLRLTTARAAGIDSVFDFNRYTRRQPTVGFNPCGRYVERPDNLFGRSLSVRPGAEYVLTGANGRTFTLRPRAPLGQPWAATATGLMARVTARTTGAVLGRPDSLVSILLSDGATLVLSKTYGWVSGPALSRYLAPRLPLRSLTLTALPEARLGVPVTGPFVIYDYQPGDVFLRREYGRGWGTPCADESWTRDSVISRYDSPGRDTIRYAIRRQVLSKPCNRPAVISPATTATLLITKNYGRFGSLTNYWDLFGPTSSQAGMLHFAAWRTAAFGSRPLQQHAVHVQCAAAAADSVVLMDPGALDNGTHYTTGAGLGVVSYSLISLSYENSDLIGYRKGTETWGQLSTFAQLLLPTTAARPVVNTAAFPNPFAHELTVQLTLDCPQSVALELRDALGRLVLQRPAALLPAGPQQVQLATAAVPAGVYTLHVQLPQAGRSEVLKVVKAQ